MSFNLPLRPASSSLRNQASRSSYFTSFTPNSSTEAVNGPPQRQAPTRELFGPADRLIVGVDFGTTFSGVAAVYTSTPDDVEIIKTWPGGNGITSDKVPTEISYDFPQNAPEGTKPNVKWGFQFKPEESRLRCIKLFLDRSQKLPFYVSPLETAAQLKRYNKNVHDEEAGLDCGFMIMTAAEIKEIFEPVVKEVCDLVQGQVDGIRQAGGVVSGIVLVGGFGQSDYLYRRLKSHFNSAAPPPYTERPTHGTMTTLQETASIEVMQPVYAWTAVVRGAVLRGLEGNMVISRKARYHYGTSYATVYDEEKHSVSERYWSPLWERWMVSDRMQWHIAKGEAISPQEPIAFHYTRNFRPGQSLTVTDDLIACEADEPPSAYTRDLIHVCTLTTDLAAVPRSLFTRLTTTRGVEFDNLDFTLEMIVDSAGLGFELKVDGVRYGRVDAEFH